MSRYTSRGDWEGLGDVFQQASEEVRAAVLAMHRPSLMEALEAGVLGPDTSGSSKHERQAFLDELSDTRKAKQELKLIANINAHAYRGFDPENAKSATEKVGIRPNRIGHSALFPQASKLEHACNPNVFHNSKSGALK
jgi:hypothetical protein